LPQLYTLREYINATLDKKYNAVTADMFRQIALLSKGSGSAVQIALRKLDIEMERLQEERTPVLSDNPVVLSALSTIEAEMLATQALISANGTEVQESGQSVASLSVMAKLFSALMISMTAAGINPVGDSALPRYKNILAASNINFIIPDKLDFASNYVQSSAWIARMEKWGEGYSDIIADKIKLGLSKGWSPIRTAREIRKYAENLPISASENITRTLQLTSYREACLGMEVLNGQYIERKIRIARLDNRTCSACIALHGTEVPLGERIDDHYNGRCDSILIPIGGSLPDSMQADSTPGNRNFVPWQNGEEWFASLSPERQAQQASFLKSPAKLAAYRDGVPLSQFVGSYEDPIFGNMIVENSLVNTVSNPEDYYINRGEP